MSHELRTPLNSIIGFSQLLELEALGPRPQKHVTFVLKAGRHLLQLINEVLDLSGIEAGRLTLSLEPVALEEVVEETVALVAPLVASSDLQLQVDTGGLAGDGHANADRNRLKQILLNLLSNAIKYNRPGGSVDISFTLEDSGRVRTTIADTGNGIAPDQLPLLFDPFERLGAEQTEIEGTGLGLALAKRLVEAMDGTIEEESTVGQGSSFTIELASADSPTTTAKPDLHPAEPVILRELNRKQKILYIEDNLSNLTLVEHILDQHPGVELLPAMQGGIGIDLAREHDPALILLDLHLPDMSGTEVLEHLKADSLTSDIPVVVLTADAVRQHAHRVLTLGPWTT